MIQVFWFLKEIFGKLDIMDSCYLKIRYILSRKVIIVYSKPSKAIIQSIQHNQLLQYNHPHTVRVSLNIINSYFFMNSWSQFKSHHSLCSLLCYPDYDSLGLSENFAAHSGKLVPFLRSWLYAMPLSNCTQL